MNGDERKKKWNKFDKHLAQKYKSNKVIGKLHPAGNLFNKNHMANYISLKQLQLLHKHEWSLSHLQFKFILSFYF